MDKKTQLAIAALKCARHSDSLLDFPDNETLDMAIAALERKEAECNKTKCFELHFGTGKYMVGNTLQSDGSGAGICVYLNRNENPALGQVDADAIGKNVESVNPIIQLQFSETASVDVWIRRLEYVKAEIIEQKASGAKEPCEHCEEGIYFDAEYGEMEGYIFCPYCGRKLGK